ncbi:methylmalonyl Co-A mutase-associated GTPase MeaB [Nakamurella endophytica]|uniref:methylmalonyl Co-A mutase-associated GTPase MeaB n=1 Tax=Nakamurella endophytica TaxID=1748367 RepID=UPI00402B0927
MAPSAGASAGPVTRTPAVHPDSGELVRAAGAGSVRAVARLLSRIEAGGDAARSVSAALAGRQREARIVGLTGAPGVGKSTVTSALVRHARRAGRRVAVLAVDPSSPFSGGALLGDRVRMAEHATDRDVYIRSLSSRGRLGGLSAATPAAVDALAALGFDLVLVETVGVGQNEVDVLSLADTVLLVLAPGMGDEIQAAKAGILEIADVLLVNKADHEHAAATVRELTGMLALGRSGRQRPGEWRVPVQRSVATRGDGIDEVAAVLDRHHAHLVTSGELEERRRRRIAAAVRAAVSDRFAAELDRRPPGAADGLDDVHLLADRWWAGLAGGAQDGG